MRASQRQIIRGIGVAMPLLLVTAIAAGASGAARHARSGQLLSIRSTQTRRAGPSAVRGLRTGDARAVKLGKRTLRFPVSGDGCSPKAVSGRVEGSTLRLLLRPSGKACTLVARFYAVTVSLSSPVLVAHRITDVSIKYGKFGMEHMRLVSA